MPNPSSFDEAKKMLPEIKGELLHRESGQKINAIVGVIEERFHGIQTKYPYQELKYWWKKSTDKEKADFLKWIEEPQLN